MTVLVAWVGLPLVLGVVSLGCGLAAERVGGFRLRGALLLPLGLAVAIAIAHFATAFEGTARLATPAVIGAAVFGLVLNPPSGRARVDPWLAAAAGFAFLAYGLPVLASGEATFAGFVKLDDTATWLGQVDRLMEHGRSLDGLSPSTYEAALESYLPRGAPIGAMLPLGLATQSLGTDPAWLIQPCMAFFAAMLALSLWEIARPLVPSHGWRALIAGVGAQPALLFNYVMWGGIKEIAAAAMIALAIATTGLAIRARSFSETLPLAIAAGALLAVLGPAGGVWLAPLLVIAAMVSFRRSGLRATARKAAQIAIPLAFLSIPLFIGNAFQAATGDVLYSANELGNLFGPLSPFQAAGIWPTGEFRASPSQEALTAILIALALASAVAAFVLAVRAGALELWIGVLGCLVGAAAVLLAGSPWVDAKGLATLSPFLLTCALVGAVAVWVRLRQPLGVVLVALVAVGVAWSNVLAYSQVNLAPFERLEELREIGEDIEGEGPTLLTSYDPYGARHFLRDADPESVSELRRRTIPLLEGGQARKGEAVDTDRIEPSALLEYRTLVLMRNPAQSRPPSHYQLVSRGRFFDVWQRDPGAPDELEHIPLGDAVHAGGAADCPELRGIAAGAAPGDQLIYVEREPNVVFELSQFSSPRSWREPGDSKLFPDSDGSARLDVEIPVSGRWRVWLGGALRAEMELFVDGREVGDLRHEFNYFRYGDLGEVELEAGTHSVELRYSGPGMHPGSHGAPDPLGPLIFSRSETPERFGQIPAGDAADLCGRFLDWIEIVR